MIVVEDDPSVIAYMERRLGVKFSEPRIVRGFMTDKGEPLAAVLFNNYSGSNIDVSVVAERVTRSVLRFVSSYVFNQLGCRRMTANIKKKNKHAREMALRCGFTFESIAKQFYPDDDAAVYRMLNEGEKKW
jgi:hypothetical protein